MMWGVSLLKQSPTTWGLFPVWGCYVYSCSTHSHTGFCMKISSHFSGTSTLEHNWVVCWLAHSVLWELPHRCQHGCAILGPQQRCRSDWVSRLPSSIQPFFHLSILTGVQWSFTEDLICIFIMTNDVKYLFICFFSDCISSSVQCYVFCCALIGFGVFYCRVWRFLKHSRC
jgi:hypothetical protein